MMKTGDKIRTIGYFEGIEGVVKEVFVGHDIEDHGGITIEVTKVTEKYNYLKPGDEEHFVHFGWEEHLEVI